MLLKSDFDVTTVADVDSALESIYDTPPDLILLDLVMPGRTGLELLRELRERDLSLLVIVLSATSTIDAAVAAMKEGAADFITKPFELEALRIKVSQLLDRRELELEVHRLRDEVSGRQRLGEMVGRSPVMLDLFRTVERIANTKATVLVTGESGTGKELVSRAIHDLSERRDAPFVAINCGAIRQELRGSAPVAYERNAVPGADELRIGRFEAADGGTLLLDEIGELDPSVQVKLLRALQERSIERLGSPETIGVDVRIVAATNRNLEQEVSRGRFRSDLYYRVNVVSFEIPPLRDRREDIRLLAKTFVDRLSKDYGRNFSIAKETFAALERYSWPGNVRELMNALERAAALGEDDTIRFDHLPDAIRSAGRSENLREALRQGGASFEETLARFERELLLEALERLRWNQTRAADELGITRRLLKLKMDRYDIVVPDRPGSERDSKAG